MKESQNRRPDPILYVSLIFTLGVLVFLITNCNAKGHPQDSQITDPVNKEIFLEMFTTSEGMVDPEDALLEIRVHSNREAEFEYYESGNRAPDQVVVVKALLKDEDFSELKDLLAKDDLRNSKEDYEPSIKLSDVLTTTSIRFKHADKFKTISLREADTTLHLDRKEGIYPPSLMRLLRLVDVMRHKYKSIKR